MKTKHKILLYWVAILLLTACGEQKDIFVIKGEINNLGGRPLLAVYNTDMGVVVDTLMPLDGKIEMTGTSSEIVPVQLYQMGWQPFMRFYLCNGERIELEGDAKNLYEIELKGNSLNRNLWKFISKHNEIFTDSYTYGLQSELSSTAKNLYKEKRARLDSLLIDYIDTHHGDIMSSILIGDYLLRYDNYALCDTLWQQLHENARLPYIARTMKHLGEELTFNKENNKLPYMRMLNEHDSICYVSTRNSKATILCMWQAADEDAEVIHRVLEHYARRYNEKQLQIVAMSFDTDTARWHSIVDSDTSQVIDLWSDALYTSEMLSKYNVTRLPVYMLSDSLGNILVRAPQLPDKEINAQIDSLVKIDKYKIETPIFKP
ncbi:MAG: DUF4369 domain-containing protein [Bacteroidaceae bacterium]|nr:DUF4369 domain-containing protein [Bacteroidaceae bacterium]